MRHKGKSVCGIRFDTVCVYIRLDGLKGFTLDGLIIADGVHSNLTSTVIGGKQEIPSFVCRNITRIRVQLDCPQM